MEGEESLWIAVNNISEFSFIIAVFSSTSTFAYHFFSLDYTPPFLLLFAFVFLSCELLLVVWKWKIMNRLMNHLPRRQQFYLLVFCLSSSPTLLNNLTLSLILSSAIIFCQFLFFFFLNFCYFFVSRFFSPDFYFSCAPCFWTAVLPLFSGSFKSPT